jgi:hypothetical protein
VSNAGTETRACKRGPSVNGRNLQGIGPTKGIPSEAASEQWNCCTYATDDAVPLICTDDAEAMEKAKQLAVGHDVELWQLDRKIATIKHIPN